MHDSLDVNRYRHTLAASEASHAHFQHFTKSIHSFIIYILVQDVYAISKYLVFIKYTSITLY